MYLLDTNVISELRKTDRAHPQVWKWANGVRSEDLFISVITITEIKTGILSLARRDAQQAQALETWLTQQILPTFSERILPITLPIALRCATLHAQRSGPQHDMLIAATALVHKQILVTRNTQDFSATGATVLNPWLAT